jgi:hypothetical protein
MIRKHNPVREKVMLDTRHIGEYSICQTLSNVYALADNRKANKEYIKLQIRVAMSMVKSMNRQLKRYKAKENELQKTQAGS